MTPCHEKSADTVEDVVFHQRGFILTFWTKLRVGAADLNLADQKQLTQDWILVSEETILSSPLLLGYRPSGVFTESLISVQGP